MPNRLRKKSAFNKQLGAKLDKSPLMDRDYSAARLVNRKR